MSIGPQFNQSLFNAWPLQPPSPAVSSDKAFRSGMIHRCAIEYDANADGSVVGDGGEVNPDWQQVVGLEDVACRIMWLSSGPTEGADRPSWMRTGRVQFDMSIVADRRNRLVYQDPDKLELEYAYLTGPVRNVHMENHHWSGNIQDQPLI